MLGSARAPAVNRESAPAQKPEIFAVFRQQLKNLADEFRDLIRPAVATQREHTIRGAFRGRNVRRNTSGVIGYASVALLTVLSGTAVGFLIGLADVGFKENILIVFAEVGTVIGIAVAPYWLVAVERMRVHGNSEYIQRVHDQAEEREARKKASKDKYDAENKKWLEEQAKKEAEGKKKPKTN